MVCTEESLPERVLNPGWTSCVFAVVDKGGGATGCGEHRGRESLWLENRSGTYLAVSSSEVKDRWRAFETQRVFMTILLIFPLLFLSI